MTSRTDAHALLRQVSEPAALVNRQVLAVVVRAEGSTPVDVGAKALIGPEGLVTGTIGGGAVEAEALRRAGQTRITGRGEVFALTLQGDGADADPICGGVMRVLIQPVEATIAAAYADAVRSLDQRERGLLLTVISGELEGGSRTTWVSAEAITTRRGVPSSTDLSACLEGERVQVVTDARGGEVLIEPVVPRPLLVIVGGGHVGQAVAQQASAVGFDLLVIDDRPEFTDPASYPLGTRTRCGAIGATLSAVSIDARTFVVLATRGHRHDAEALATCLRRPAAYVGMIGSRRKVAMMRKDFIASRRATPAEFDRVYAPIGLDIGARTVPEIATSVVAQLISVRRTGTAGRIPLRTP